MKNQSNLAPSLIITHCKSIDNYKFLISHSNRNYLQSMNYLKNSLRVKFKLTNPYEIKPQFTILPKVDIAIPEPEPKKVSSILLNKNVLNEDYTIMRFGLQDSTNPNTFDQRCLGLKIGQYVWIQANGDKRPYVPISRIDQAGYLDILVRDMRTKNKNSFTQKLFNLPVDSEVTLLGPGTQFIYEGFGRMKYISQSTSKLVDKVYKNIGIITHSSAITTTYALIQSIATNFDNQTGVSLLWIGDNESDFIFIDELVSYVEQYKLNMNLMLTKMTKGWYGPFGRLMEDQIRDFLPFPGSNQLLILSGLEGECAYIPELVKKMGYTDYLNF